MKKLAIIVHGGAGNWPKNKQALGLAGVRQATTIGFEMLQKGNPALRVVEAAVVEMENNPVFNAGTGATLNLAGEVEADAGIMDGGSLRGAGVAIVHRVKNPVKLARIVLEKTDHALVAGKGAEDLADLFRLKRADLRRRDKVTQWKQARLKIRRRGLAGFRRSAHLVLDNYRHFLGDTVGALAIDSNGNLAAADSTGGVFLKLPGRVGDSPLLGAGLYADNQSGAATATGLGEIAMRLVISKAACDAMRTMSAQKAARRTIRRATLQAGKGVGIITLDRAGTYGVAHNTRHICWAAQTFGEGLVSGMSQ